MKKYIIMFIIGIIIMPTVVIFASNTQKSIDDEINEMQVLFFTGSYEKGVTFDLDGAKKAGYSEAAIKIVSEISDINSEVISRSKRSEKIKTLLNVQSSTTEPNDKIDFSKYTEFKDYMSGLEKRRNKTIGGTISLFANAGAFDATTICGSYTNPRPTSAAPRTVINKGTQAAANSYLISIGFHTTSSTYGGGYTRPQSWNSRICGVGSFRDQAIIQSGGNITIQDYSGYSPRGEPNPEINTYTWPYLAWPSYVYWWHMTY